MMFIIVDLPEPEAPVSARKSLRLMDSDTSLSAGYSTPPSMYRFEMPISSIKGT